VLVQVGTSWRGTWALGPFTVRRQAPDVRAGGRMSGGSRGAGCPGWTCLFPVLSGQAGPDIRVGRPDVRGVGKSRMSGAWGRMSGLSKSLPDAFGDGGPDFRGHEPDVRAGAGCPAAVAAGSSSFSFLRSRAHLALVLELSMVYSGVPEYAQGPRLK
jgi:hypothetical protein